jgi:hypothetical protein
MIFSYPPCEEIKEHVENCQENEALQSWSMVMSGPHKIDKFSKLSYILPCFCDPYYDRIVDWLEDCYMKNIQKNGKVMLTLFLNECLGGKHDIFSFYLQVMHSFIMIFDFLCLAGLKTLLWLHWKYNFT